MSSSVCSAVLGIAAALLLCCSQPAIAKEQRHEFVVSNARSLYLLADANSLVSSDKGWVL
jgi:hypothetical protein